jgi:hypothetical protein
MPVLAHRLVRRDSFRLGIMVLVQPRLVVVDEQ